MERCRPGGSSFHGTDLRLVSAVGRSEEERGERLAHSGLSLRPGRQDTDGSYDDLLLRLDIHGGSVYVY